MAGRPVAAHPSAQPASLGVANLDWDTLGSHLGWPLLCGFWRVALRSLGPQLRLGLSWMFLVSRAAEALQAAADQKWTAGEPN